MGNNMSSLNDYAWNCVGRTHEVERVLKFFDDKTQKLLFIGGLKKIGKSTLLLQSLKNVQCQSCIYKDFEHEFTGEHFQRSWIHDLRVYFGKTAEWVSNLNDEESFALFLKQFCNAVNECGTPVILCLDNVDPLLQKDFRDIFQTFVDKIVNQCRNLKVVITSNETLSFTTKRGKVQVTVPKLGEDDIMKLLKEVVEHGEIAWSADNYMHAIARLCDGLPNAAIMAGCILTEDGGMIRPVEMVELLIHFRLRCLSPENYPAADRLDIYKSQLEKMEDSGIREYLNNLATYVCNPEFTEDDALSASGDDKTLSVLKMDTLRTLLHNHILQFTPKRLFILHGVLRECLITTKAAKLLSSTTTSSDMEQLALSVVKQNAKNVGLDGIPDEVLQDAKQLEAVIQELDNTKRENKYTQRDESSEIDHYDEDYSISDGGVETKPEARYEFEAGGARITRMYVRQGPPTVNEDPPPSYQSIDPCQVPHTQYSEPRNFSSHSAQDQWHNSIEPTDTHDNHTSRQHVEVHSLTALKMNPSSYDSYEGPPAMMMEAIVTSNGYYTEQPTIQKNHQQHPHTQHMIPHAGVRDKDENAVESIAIAEPEMHGEVSVSSAPDALPYITLPMDYFPNTNAASILNDECVLHHDEHQFNVQPQELLVRPNIYIEPHDNMANPFPNAPLRQKTLDTSTNSPHLNVQQSSLTSQPQGIDQHMPMNEYLQDELFNTRPSTPQPTTNSIPPYVTQNVMEPFQTSLGQQCSPYRHNTIYKPDTSTHASHGDHYGSIKGRQNDKYYKRSVLPQNHTTSAYARMTSPNQMTDMSQYQISTRTYQMEHHSQYQTPTNPYQMTPPSKCQTSTNPYPMAHPSQNQRSTNPYQMAHPSQNQMSTIPYQMTDMPQYQTSANPYQMPTHPSQYQTSTNPYPMAHPSQNQRSSNPYPMTHPSQNQRSSNPYPMAHPSQNQMSTIPYQMTDMSQYQTSANPYQMPTHPSQYQTSTNPYPMAHPSQNQRSSNPYPMTHPSQNQRSSNPYPMAHPSQNQRSSNPYPMAHPSQNQRSTNPYQMTDMSQYQTSTNPYQMTHPSQYQTSNGQQSNNGKFIQRVSLDHNQTGSQTQSEPQLKSTPAFQDPAIHGASSNRGELVPALLKPNNINNEDIQKPQQTKHLSDHSASSPSNTGITSGDEGSSNKCMQAPCCGYMTSEPDMAYRRNYSVYSLQCPRTPCERSCSQSFNLIQTNIPDIPSYQFIVPPDQRSETVGHVQNYLTGTTHTTVASTEYLQGFTSHSQGLNNQPNSRFIETVTHTALSQTPVDQLNNLNGVREETHQDQRIDNNANIKKRDRSLSNENNLCSIFEQVL